MPKHLQLKNRRIYQLTTLTVKFAEACHEKCLLFCSELMPSGYSIGVSCIGLCGCDRGEQRNACSDDRSQRRFFKKPRNWEKMGEMFGYYQKAHVKQANNWFVCSNRFSQCFANSLGKR